MASTTDQAVCIRQWDWSETSQTVSLFGRTQGLIRGIAKGAKRERSRFSGGFEVLTRGEIQAIIKPSAELATLTAWDLQEVFPAVRRTLSAHYAGMYMADLVRHILTERDPHPLLFDRMLESLRGLGEPAQERWAILGFQWSSLVETGYKPELALDVVTGRPLTGGRTFAFLPRQGGFAADAGGPAGPTDGPTWRVRAQTLDLLRAVSRGEPGRSDSASLDAADRANRLLASYLREILGRVIPSMALVFGEVQG